MATMPGEIVLPETRPETEWLLGRAVQKMSPFRRHAVIQAAMAALLGAWAAGRGQAGTEWRFRLAPRDEVRRPLVPDVAYVSYDRLRPLSEADREVPPIAPDIAVEIRSPGDRERYLAHKKEVYFATGTLVFIVVDPLTRSVTVDDLDGSTSTFRNNDVLTVARFPDLAIMLAMLFANLDVPG
jgi:Uma2 family endonuclease